MDIFTLVLYLEQPSSLGNENNLLLLDYESNSNIFILAKVIHISFCLTVFPSVTLTSLCYYPAILIVHILALMISIAVVLLIKTKLFYIFGWSSVLILSVHPQMIALIDNLGMLELSYHFQT